MMLSSYSNITLIFIKYIDYSLPLFTEFNLLGFNLFGFNLLGFSFLDLASAALDPIDGAPPFRGVATSVGPLSGPPTGPPIFTSKVSI